MFSYLLSGGPNDVIMTDEQARTFVLRACQIPGQHVQSIIDHIDEGRPLIVKVKYREHGWCKMNLSRLVVTT